MGILVVLNILNYFLVAEGFSRLNKDNLDLGRIFTRRTLLSAIGTNARRLELLGQLEAGDSEEGRVRQEMREQVSSLSDIQLELIRLAQP